MCTGVHMSAETRGMMVMLPPAGNGSAYMAGKGVEGAAYAGQQIGKAILADRERENAFLAGRERENARREREIAVGRERENKVLDRLRHKHHSLLLVSTLAHPSSCTRNEHEHACAHTSNCYAFGLRRIV
jgi:hypothetical protein